ETVQKRASAGDILLSVRAPVGAVNIAQDELGIGRGLVAIRAQQPAHQKWLYWVLEAARPYFESVSVGSTFQAITAKDIENLSVRVPESPEAVADYLDHETTQIDNFVADVLRMLALLEERTKVEIRMLLDEFGKFDDGELRKLSWDLQISSGQYLSTANFEKEPTEGAEVPVYGGNGIVGYTDTALIVDKTVIIGRVGANCG